MRVDGRGGGRAVGDELVVALGKPKWKMAAGGMGRGVKDRGGMTMKSGEKLHFPCNLRNKTSGFYLTNC